MVPACDNYSLLTVFVLCILSLFSSSDYSLLRSHELVECATYYLILVRFREFDELYRVAGYTNR